MHQAIEEWLHIHVKAICIESDKESRMHGHMDNASRSLQSGHENLETRIGVVGTQTTMLELGTCYDYAPQFWTDLTTLRLHMPS